MEDSKKASSEVKSIVKNPANEIFVSVVTVWEVVIKRAKGRLKAPKDIRGGINEAGFKTLPIEISHALEVEKLPLLPGHQDPFDRMLVAQAKVEGLTLITSDPKIWKYRVSLLKA